MATKEITKRWICSYAGSSDWIINGRRYVVRSFANTRMPYNHGVLEAKIEEVGTVRYDESKYWHDFPPSEVVALFPGFVGARFTDDYQIEYDGPKPRTIPSKKVPEYITAEGLESDYL